MIKYLNYYDGLKGMYKEQKGVFIMVGVEINMVVTGSLKAPSLDKSNTI